jgi:predicted dehydrogenase
MCAKVGIIGCGAVAKAFHLPALTQLPTIELWSAADIDKQSLMYVARRFKIRKPFVNYKEMLRDPLLDLVIICTPPHLHAEMVIEAARNGKHIIVEKPFTLTVSGAIASLNAVKEAGVKLCVVHNYRYYPAMKRCKERVEKGYIGRILSIQGVGHVPIPLGWTKNLWLYNKSIGVLYDFGPHLMDAILWLVGSSVKEVFAYGGDFLGNMNCDNYAQITILFDNKAVAVADLSWLTGIRIFSLDIRGSGGCLYIDVFNNHLFEFHKSPDPLGYAKSTVSLLASSFKGTMNREKPKLAINSFKNLIDDFLNNVKRDREQPLSSDVELVSVAALEAAKLSLTQGRPVLIKELLRKANYL